MINPHLRPNILVTTLVALALVALPLAGCGDDDDGDTGGEATTTTTPSAEDELQTVLDDALESCRNRADQISNATLSNAAAAACDQLDTDLSRQLAGAASEAKGDVNAALENLARECSKRAAQLSAGQDAALQVCNDLLAARV
jgi:hypothetical protein